MKRIILFMATALMLGGCAKTGNGNADSVGIRQDSNSTATDSTTIEVAQGNPCAGADAKVTPRGFIVAGDGKDIRAFTTFKSGEGVSRAYINLINDMQGEFPDLNFYAIVIPGQAAYYVPDKIKDSSKPMKPAFDYLKAHLDPKIKYVDVYNALAAHTNENIFLRTDHHWAPLGAYYVARELAKEAGVPFKDLKEYDEHVVHGYVGSMVKYTGDSRLKENPEDFYYYTPKGTNETTTYIPIKKNDETGALSEGAPYKGSFFHHYPDGSGGAYCTFMGGDHYIVKVETGVPNSRRLLVIKDSHGNPIPAYLFNSFEEIHVIDYRYFTKNLRKYIGDNKITDVALAFGINTSSGSGNMKKVKDFLTQ